MGADVPSVTVVVTCYRQVAYVVEALDSVLAQTHADWELIVTDDASDDGSAGAIRGWAGRCDRPIAVVVHDVNVGLPETLNEVLPRCRGTYLAYLGGDDAWAPDKLALLVAALDAAPDAAVAYSDARLVDAGRDELAPSFMATSGHLPAPEGDVFDSLLRSNVVVASSAVYRRSAIETVGGWDAALPFEDWDLLLRLADRWPMVFVPGALVDFRIHDESATRTRFSSMLAGRMAVMEKWLGRRSEHDAVIVPYLRSTSWRVFKVHPDLGRAHVAVAYRSDRTPRGRARRLVATSPAAERTFDAVRQVRRRFR